MQEVKTDQCSKLPYEELKWVVHYENEEGTMGGEAYPINYDELYNLKGRLLTLVDATFTDPEQRKALKDLVWATLRAWMENVEFSAKNPVPRGEGFVTDQAEAG